MYKTWPGLHLPFIFFWIQKTLACSWIRGPWMNKHLRMQDAHRCTDARSYAQACTHKHTRMRMHTHMHECAYRRAHAHIRMNVCACTYARTFALTRGQKHVWIYVQTLCAYLLSHSQNNTQQTQTRTSAVSFAVFFSSLWVLFSAYKYMKTQKQF